MFIGCISCDWKCCNEQSLPNTICQNSKLKSMPEINMPVDEIFHRYIENDITKCIVIGGLEPMLQFDELVELIDYFRKNKNNDEFVIYTGYYPEEIQDKISHLQLYNNIVIKFGRYIKDSKPRFDYILGVNLASDNQYAKKIS